MGKQAKLKAERKAARAAVKQAPPNYIPTALVAKEVARGFQIKRDRALAQLKRDYEAAQQAIRQQYWLDISGASRG